MTKLPAALAFLVSIFVVTPVFAQLSQDAQLVRAIKKGDLRDLQTRIVNGGNVNARDSDGVTALIHAARSSEASVVQFLIRNGARPNDEARKTRETPLMVAAERGDPRVVKLLISSGADVDAQDSSGETALIRAARRGRSEAAKALIEAGADYEIEDYGLRTPLRHAQNNRRRVIIDILTKAGATF